MLQQSHMRYAYVHPLSRNCMPKMPFSRLDYMKYIVAILRFKLTLPCRIVSSLCLMPFAISPGVYRVAQK